MAEEGRGQRHSAPKVAPVTGQPFKTFDTPSGRTKVKKALPRASGHSPLFGFHQKFTRQKFSNRENFFQLSPFLPTKFFHFSSKKIGKKVCALHARKRAQSVSRYWPMSLLTRFFRTAKKSLISRLLAFKPQKSVQLLNLTLWHFLHVRLFCFLYVFQKSYRFRYHFSYQ